jgi:hypothetical protein
MRRRLLVLVLALTCVAGPVTASAGLISLRIEFRAKADSKPRILTLRCGERATGTVPHAALACRRLQLLGSGAFRPTPPDAACTAIFGGPSTARIVGTFLGRALWVKVGRRDGCAIARWQRVAFLLPPPAAP